jgi:hypothetical protein
MKMFFIAAAWSILGGQLDLGLINAGGRLE